MKNILITSANKQLSLTQEIIKKAKEVNADRKVYTCDMYPESIPGIVDSDGCFKVPICTSEDYVETIFSLCLGYNISHIITMTEREFIILSANKDMFGKYGIEVVDGRRKMDKIESHRNKGNGRNNGKCLQFSRILSIFAHEKKTKIDYVYTEC